MITSDDSHATQRLLRQGDDNTSGKSTRTVAIAVVAILIVSAMVAFVYADQTPATDKTQDIGDNSDTSARAKTTITVSAPTGTNYVGNSLTIAGTLVGDASISGATINVSVILPGGSSDLKTATTDSIGVFSLSYLPQTAGTYTFSVAYAGDSKNLGSSALVSVSVISSQKQIITVPYPWPTSMEWTSKPDNMVVGSTYTFSVRMMVTNYDAYGNPQGPWYANDTAISFTFTNANGYTVQQESRTAWNGIASTTFMCCYDGNWEISASFKSTDLQGKYQNYDQRATISSVQSDHPKYYWNGMWIETLDAMVTANPRHYPVSVPSGWIGSGKDPVFIKVRLTNALSTINTNIYLSNLYVTDTNGNAYMLDATQFRDNNPFRDGLAPGGSIEVWLIWQVPIGTHLNEVNGAHPVIEAYPYWSAQGYHVDIPLPTVRYPDG